MFVPGGIDTPKILSLTRQVLSVGTIIGSLAAFGWVASGAIPSINSLAYIRWMPLAGAIILQLVMVFVLMVIWERLLGLLWTPESNAEAPSRSSLYTAYSRSWLARYIPGRIWALGGRALMASRLDVPVEAVAHSMAIEVVFTYTLAAIIGGALIVAASFHVLGGGALLVFGLIAFAASIYSLPKVLNAGMFKTETWPYPKWPKIRQLIRRLIIGESYPALPNTAWGIFVYGFYSCMQLGFIVLIAASFADLTAQQAAIIAGAWGVSLTIGWISFVAPVGLGVRDGLAFALFTQVLDAPTASPIVMTSRITTLGIDLVFVGAVELLALGLSRSRRGIATPARHTAAAASAKVNRPMPRDGG